MELRDAIQKIALEFESNGYRRITAELNGRFAVKAFAVTTDSRHNLRVYPNLTRNETPRPDQSTLSGRSDLHPAAHRVRVPGGCCGCIFAAGDWLGPRPHLASEFGGCRRWRWPCGKGGGVGFDSDRDVQYISNDYTELKQHQIQISMSRKDHTTRHRHCDQTKQAIALVPSLDATAILKSVHRAPRAAFRGLTPWLTFPTHSVGRTLGPPSPVPPSLVGRPPNAFFARL
jgi:hypothetical protein